MSADIKAFPGVVDPGQTNDKQPQQTIIEFCANMLARAQRGEVQSIAVAMVLHGRETADAWRLGLYGTKHELMASISYLQNRFAADANAHGYKVEET